MADKGSLKQIIQALSGLPSGATVADFNQAMAPERYAVPLDRRPATVRAPTYGEQLREVVERLAGSVQAQPVGRLLDALLGGGLADTANGVSPPLMRWGQMPDGPTKAGREALAREVAERVKPETLWHTSPDVFPSGKPDFPAYYGTRDFLRTFPNEFGPNTYALRMPRGANVLDIGAQSDTARRVRQALAEVTWNEKLDDLGPDDLYEAWTDKEKVLAALQRAGVAPDAVRYGEEYIVPSETISRGVGRRVK